MSKWPIETGKKLSNTERETYWNDTHVEGDYDSVWSMTEDSEVRNRIKTALNSVSPLQQILIPGCGSRTGLERFLLDSFENVHITATDFPKVTDLAASRLQDDRLRYLGRNSRELEWQNQFDAVVVVNSILSEDDQENRDILKRCAQALREGGALIGFFPTVFATVDIALLEKSEERMSLANLERSSILEEKQGLEQIFYTPLRLRRIIQESELRLELCEIFFCDSPYFVKHGYDYYGLDDPDLVIYEHFVVARK